MNPPFDWLKKSIIEHLDWVSTKELLNAQGRRISIDEFLESWIFFLTVNQFLKLYGTVDSPKGYLIARPVRVGWIFDTDIDYFQTLFVADRGGEAVWIDSLWAPGFYGDVVAFLRSTQKPYVAWSHKDKLYFKEISKLSGKVPSKDEVKDGIIGTVSSNGKVEFSF